ncbi:MULTISPECIES: hypothetical protein [unclassified Polaribacter]|uniref:hypothetical protein n=1 Tax=unclassified Polaribacter TaxID=196858 RepID=UPI00167271E0|nr:MULTISPECIES: hypothetical protein [unclassified Polaribacter]
MGLGGFLNNDITFNQLTVSQVSGPNVTINADYNGDTDTFLLMPNNTLGVGEKVVL